MSHTTPQGHIRGIDGKFYPPLLPEDDRQWLMGRVHYLSHDDRLSIRQIQAAILQENGVRRSVGWISGVLHGGFTCEACPGVQVSPNATPEHLTLFG